MYICIYIYVYMCTYIYIYTIARCARRGGSLLPSCICFRGWGGGFGVKGSWFRVEG